MSRSFAQASLLAMTLGLAALGSTLTPAAALTSMHPGSLTTRLPSLPAQTAPGASLHPGGAMIHLPQVALSAPATSMYPVGTKIHLPQNPQTAPGAGLYPGKLRIPEPMPLPTPVDNVCPLNPSKCPPKAPNGSGTANNPAPGPGSTPSMPAGQNYPSGGTGPVVIVAPPPVYQAPRTIITATTAPALTTAPAAATAPCNCLTKQYLADGGVLFQDLCTKEAAMATPDELRAQAQTGTPMVR